MAQPKYMSQQALNRAVVEAVEYVHAEGWERTPSLFALVPTELLAESLGDTDPEFLDSSPLTVVAQEPLPEGVEGGTPELADFIARTSWPQGVIGAVLSQEVLIVAPEHEDLLNDATLDEIRAGTGDNAARPARLISGVLSDGPEVTLIQPRPTDAELEQRGAFAEDEIELRDASGMADGVIAALRATFEAQ